MTKIYLQEYLFEDAPVIGGQPDPIGPQPTSGDAMSGSLAPASISNSASISSQNNQSNLNQNNNQSNLNQNNEKDVSQDPETPEMPEEKEEKDFETWKQEYFKDSIKSDSQKLIDLINSVRERDELLPSQRKFIEDNFNIQLLRQNSNIEKASKDIRKNITSQIDKNNPATSLIYHISASLESILGLSNIFIKLKGYGNLKGDLHRKYIASLIGGVQVGSGGNSEDVIFNEREFSILLSTRFNSEWGDVMIGSWSMKEDDPERYLSEPELKRLKIGSPEEKDVLKRRIMLESIAKQFEKRAFVINVVEDDGTINFVGLDIASCLRGAYKDGKLIVKTSITDNSEAFLADNGDIIPYMDFEIFYSKPTGNMKENGQPEIEELPFMQKRNGILFLNANLKTIKLASDSLQGMSLKQIPYRGNSSDLKVLSRCVFTTSDLLLRQC